MTQEMTDQLKQLEVDHVHLQVYGTCYLIKDDGSVVLRYPNGAEGPIPTIEGYDEL